MQKINSYIRQVGLSFAWADLDKGAYIVHGGAYQYP